jgi:hypothetical protein
VAKLECDQCHRCGYCKFTNEHAQACQVLLTEAYVSIVCVHEADSHPSVALDIARRGNEIQVKRLFSSIVGPQVNEHAAEILEEWLLKGTVDVDQLPNEIPRLWK